MDLPYDELPLPPVDPAGGAILAHLTDAAGFRFARATDGLTDAVCAFVPPGGGMGLLALLRHVRDLAARIREAAAGDPSAAPEGGLAALCTGTRVDLAAASQAFAALDADGVARLSIRSGRGHDGTLWNVVHGPLADLLTHVGQINTLRRVAGSPPPPTDHFNAAPREGAAPSAAPLAVTDADLSEASFTDVALTGARFDDVSLAGAKFTNVTLAGATLHDVDLSNVNITDANLEGLRIDGEPWNA